MGSFGKNIVTGYKFESDKYLNISRHKIIVKLLNWQKLNREITYAFNCMAWTTVIKCIIVNK